MNLRILGCIAMGIFTTYLGVVMLWDQLRPRAKFVPPPKPNFSSRAQVISVDAKTGEKTIAREITVSTKLAEADERTSQELEAGDKSDERIRERDALKGEE